ncbi:MAG: HigA family addiction module antidote protein [Ignavibacteriaceae bacterium]|nr:HigA family addiction module antidote protein [Ignavibacterium sp.]MCC6254931.1 HigA family addiction module antidote protein [Ignavibacteriaceae bacterium]HRN26670.1 HigA family addiction module antitoxin [Ignavibacteriaceae bacterium]HRP93900.1 HigA family addiction module antitoxin [Ignavibacteriaceae bacterium]
MLKLKRKPTHPGEILNEEFLKPLEVSQTLLAEAIGVSFRSVNELVNEKRNLSSEMAIKLSKYFGTSPELWLNLQTQYDIYHVSKYISKELNQIKPYSR